ncbi:hypothetical protein [Nocardia sp. NPDC127526]|uniref:hypothetical protein n=1 Tax=Nocardia sp. NPDC127526 TaxID=3345393 RepID=UPI003639BE94
MNAGDPEFAAEGISGYLARATRQRLLEEDLRSLAEFERNNPQPSLAEEFPQE